MVVIFYIAAFIAVLSTILVITRLNAVHALLFLIVSLLSVAIIFFILGAPFMAALEVIIYAGAIMVLFIFVIMMLNLGNAVRKQESQWLSRRIWIGPGIMTLILIIQLLYIILSQEFQYIRIRVISPRQVGLSLFGPYLIAIELVALLLLAGMIGAYHLGRKKKKVEHRFLEEGKI